MDDREIERYFYDGWDVTKQIIKKMIGLALTIYGYIREGIKEIWKGEKWE